jgi:hypothetical protein
LFTQVIIQVDTILKYIEAMMVFPRYDNSCSVYRSKWSYKQNHT